MAERNYAEKITVDNMEIESIDVMTGDRNRQRYLYYQLKMSMQRAKQIDIIVSFLMESGVKMILNDLKAALDRGVSVRILTGNYLGITQPSALYLIKSELGERVDLRFYQEKERSFHPKSYIFHYENESEIYIGSSNVSRSALTSGIEWNYRFRSNADEESFKLFYGTFEDLFNHHSIVIDNEELKNYSKNWKRPAVEKDLSRYDEAEENENYVVKRIIEPRGAQIEALYALDANRKEGATKAVVQAATGVGKTYLAAFDSKDYERVLFVAHREEILKQAANSFYNVRQSEDYGFFYGKEKEKDKSVIFASVNTLGREEYLSEKYFSPEHFDYIVIDEFHHAVTNQYQRIVQYFKPQFLLGLTATPERMDGKDILKICNYNVPYEITLKEAINKGILVPFHYYGIYDKTDYSTLHVIKGRYDQKELNETYIGNVKRYDLIHKYYKKYRSQRALGFCCSRQHAEDMAREFCKRNISAVAVYSNAQGEFSEDREVAIQKLKTGEVKVIFSVDMFNEGVDIPSVDTVMFLRPTESPIVFLQQLGRGLRKAKGKTYLNVLDFIGNYHKAGNVPLLLSGMRNEEIEGTVSERIHELDYPEDCIVDFDMRLVDDVFKKMEQRGLKIQERIRNEYYRIKELLDGKVPSRMDLFTYMEDDIYALCKKNSKHNIFKSYFVYLYEQGEMSADEKEIYDGIGREFLQLLEKTDMNHVYKMPVLNSFYNNGKVRSAITEEDVLISWKEFFNQGTNWKDLSSVKTYDEYKNITDKAHLSNIKKNPAKFLRESGKGFFVQRDGYVLALCKELDEVITKPAFVAQMKDIIEYRTMEYYRKKYEEQ